MHTCVCLMILYICKIFNTPFTHFFKCKFYLFSQHFLARTDVDRDDDELEDAGEDEDHADEHPDVQEGDIGHPGYILSHLKIFGSDKQPNFVSFKNCEEVIKLR